MLLSLIYGRFFALYFFVLALLLLFRKKEIRVLVGEFIATPGLIAFSGTIYLIGAALIVVTHPVWELSWRGVITLLGYFGILKGIIRIGFQNYTRAIMGGVLQERGYWITFGVLVLVALYFAYYTFISPS